MAQERSQNVKILLMYDTQHEKLRNEDPLSFFFFYLCLSLLPLRKKKMKKKVREKERERAVHARAK